MTVKKSQGFCQAQLDRRLVKIAQGNVIALVDGGSNDDSITSSNIATVDFVALGFKAGDKIYVVNATDSNDDITAVKCTAVTQDTITLPTGTFSTGQAAGSTTLAILAADGGSAADLMNDSTIYVLKSAQSATPDDAASSSDVVTTFSNVTYGESSWNSTDKKAKLELLATLSANAAQAGTVLWFRQVAKGHEAWTASTTAIRLDGTVSPTGDLQISNTTVALGAPQAVTTAPLVAVQ